MCGTDMWGRQIQGRGMWMIIAKVRGKCDISFFVKMTCVILWFHLPKPHWTPYDVYTEYFLIIGVSTLTIVMRVSVDFHCRVILFMPTCVKFTFTNKIEAMSERSHVSVKVESCSTSHLISTIYILPLAYLRD